MLKQLREKLRPAERNRRDGAFQEAHSYVEQAADAGGVWVSHRPLKKSFPVRPRRDRRRVDVEVLRGRAFVPDLPDNTKVVRK